jgi:hypothetical protein
VVALVPVSAGACSHTGTSSTLSYGRPLSRSP